MNTMSSASVVKVNAGGGTTWIFHGLKIKK